MDRWWGSKWRNRRGGSMLVPLFLFVFLEFGTWEFIFGADFGVVLELTKLEKVPIVRFEILVIESV